MNKKLLFSFISFLAIAFLFASSVEAKRFGGGSSFGGKKSYSSPFKKNTAQKKSFSQQKAASSNQQRKQQLSKKGGLMGMLGGLALGGLLGALFFGGAFENFNFFDFLIIGGIIFAVMWFMKRKKQGTQARTATPNGFDFKTDTTEATDNRLYKDNTLIKQDADFTQNFTAGNKQKNSAGDVSFAESFGMNSDHTANSSEQSPFTAQENNVILPDWFNQEEFLSGARSAYTLLQEAWDSGNLEEIKALTTDSVFAEISRQHAEEASSGTTRILKLNSELIDFNESPDQVEAAVLFDALLGEADSQSNNERAVQVRELWHFMRKANSTEPTWYLDGIQQLD